MGVGVGDLANFYSTYTSNEERRDRHGRRLRFLRLGTQYYWPRDLSPGPSGQSASSAHARQARRRAAARRRLDLRAEVGWLSRAGVPRWGRNLHSKPGRKAARPLLPRADRSVEGTVAKAMRTRRRDRDRAEGSARLRGAAAAAASGGVAREDVVRPDPRVDRILRSALRGQARLDARAFRQTARSARVIA